MLAIDNPKVNYSNTQCSLIEVYEKAIALLTPLQIYDRYSHNFRTDGTGKLRGIPHSATQSQVQVLQYFPMAGFTKRAMDLPVLLLITSTV